MRRLEEQRHVSTAAAIEKSGTANTMVGQKSGPALAGPAAPATTALVITLRKSTFGSACRSQTKLVAMISYQIKSVPMLLIAF